jgi:hypothetical protein
MSYRVDYPVPTGDQRDDFRENLAKRMADLEEHHSELPNEWSQKFCESLLEYYDKHDRLSSNQMDWAIKFWLWLADHPGSDVNSDSKGTAIVQQQQVVTVVADGKALIAHFDKAAEGLKYPSVKWISPMDSEPYTKHDLLCMRFYRTSERNKLGAGAVQVVGQRMKAQGPDDGGKEFVCAILRDGTVKWYPFASTKLDLQQLLRKLIEDFVPEMQVNGRKFKRCCFCSRELTDSPSIVAGYGPICADKWGLPWGEATEVEIKLGVTL